VQEVRKLFEPIKIGQMELKNRIVLAAMVANFANEDGFVTDRLVAYHANIARGGCSLNVTESSHVSLEGKRITCALGAHDDKLIPGFRELTEAVHAEGGKIAQQIHHGGRECSSEITGLQPIGPSNLASRYSGISKKTDIPRQMTLEDIEIIISKFGDAGQRAREGGFDAVEIHGAHGYLINQFLSPYANKRNDRYGGDIYGRSRFLQEIILDVKKKAGEEFPVLVKLNINDYVEGGVVPGDACITAKLAVEAGADAIICSVGLHESRPYIMIPAMQIPPFTNVHFAAMVKEYVDVPVGTVGRIIEPKKAAKIIKERKADFVVMGRGLLADPEWPKKAMEGRYDDIRECIACNQGCIDNIHRMKPFTCLQNPVIGREKEFEIRKAEKPKKVIVIGGGPAGLESARVAALRGHDVTLYEKETDVGGQVRMGRVPPNRGDLGKATDYLARQVRKLGIQLELGKNVTKETVKNIDAEVIVLATGAVPLVPDIEGVDKRHVVYAVDVLDRKASVGKRVVVIGAGLVGLEVADYLVEQGRDITLLEMLPTTPPDIGNANRIYFENKFAENGIEIHFGAEVERIDEDGIVYTQKGWTQKLMGIDTVVLATGAVPENSLEKILRNEKRFSVFAVGDCVKARNAMEAIYEGSKIGREI
jgi:2,4-dienoyl-CoA reductase-like NADH-dependent reductase (Old Yellow Enzyme family)/thioredoxin reductase